jgi:hypothetical protein
MKKPNKKNEQKLKLYLSKTNDIKPGNTKDSKTIVGAQASQIVQKGTAR